MSRVFGVEARQHRVAVHAFKWGLHFKLRRYRTWRHLVVKLVSEYDYGNRAARRALWIGWWVSRKGERAGMSGVKFAVTRVKRLRPSPNMNVPMYPRNFNGRKEAYEKGRNHARQTREAGG